MKESLRRELRELLPACLVCVVLPLPAIFFGQSVGGRSIALGCFFIGCAILAAYSFQRDVRPPPGSAASGRFNAAQRTWGERMSALAVAAFAAFAIFSTLCLIFNNPPETEEQAIWWRAGSFRNPRDLIAPMLAFMAIFPAICVVPYLTLATRKPFPAVVFALFLLFSMKLLGATVVVFVYGWDADAQGRTKMPWNQPDLLVWLFWGFTAVLSVSFYFLGAKRFRRLRRGQPWIT